MTTAAARPLKAKTGRRVGRPLEARLVKQGRELASARALLERYQAALRGSSVTVWAQDEQLRYTAISNPIFGRAVDDIIGRSDEEVLPMEGRATLITLKRGVLESGEPVNREIALGTDGRLRWFDVHIEPLRGEGDAIIGLTCAAIDVTERKENEAHLRLLLRELTHRSKNLLAVIQAMARQTAKHAGSIDGFLDHFSARLQALAASHDLLVQESWHGASLQELVRSQLGHYLNSSFGEIKIAGPPVTLRPEATQSLGLALHELATNAAKYGALSVPQGRVAITWRRRAEAEGGGLELTWRESGGPPVKPPRRAGFGTLVIQHNLSRALDAEVDLAFAAEGLTCRIVLCDAQLLHPRAKA